MADVPRSCEHLAGLTSPDAQTRLAAVRACARAADPAAVDRLRKLAGEDPSVEVRYQARVALNAIRRASLESSAAFRTPPSLPPDPTADDIRRRLASSDPAERMWALREAVLHDEASGLIENVASRVPLETVADVRAQLVTTLAEMGGRELRPHLEVFLRDPDARVRANAVEAAEGLTDARLLELVAKTLQDPDHRVKLNAVVALHRAGKLSLLKCCEKLSREPSYWVRDATMYCLAQARLPEAVPLLARGLADPHEPVRIKARQGLEAMAEIGVEAAREALEAPSPAWDPAPDPWEAGQTPLDEGHIPLVLDRLRGAIDHATIVKLIRILGSLGNPVVVPIICDYSKSPDPDVSGMAATALRRLGAEHLAPPSAQAPALARVAAPQPEPSPAPPVPIPGSSYGLLVTMLSIAAVVGAILYMMR
jgi:HEAT repeat protein